ncbi:hypothetical protein FQN57_004418 [Myotisia sp. PD_48]|nr:hypothetical protein FQN57_004418 [Myotisia sp. PD_48]
MAANPRPRALLFDIGGVCVVSPFQAILDYEIEKNIPLGWINYSIQHTSPNGAWHRLERGEVKIDAEWFKQFNSDFRHTKLWERFNAQSNPSIAGSELPPIPTVDAEYVFWGMMRMSRNPDPYMFPALQKLKDSGLFVMGGLSNTAILPKDHKLGDQPPASTEVKKFFDFFISSAHSGLRKPDPRIYALAMEEINAAAKLKGVAGGEIKPEEVVFLDDIGINLKFAAKAGIRTIKVNLGQIPDAVKQLEQYTGLSLLENGSGGAGQAKL